MYRQEGPLASDGIPNSPRSALRSLRNRGTRNGINPVALVPEDRKLHVRWFKSGSNSNSPSLHLSQFKLHFEQIYVLTCHTVNGRNPAPTIVRWYLQGNHHSVGFLRRCEMDFATIHSIGGMGVSQIRGSPK